MEKVPSKSIGLRPGASLRNKLQDCDSNETDMYECTIITWFMLKKYEIMIKTTTSFILKDEF